MSYLGDDNSLPAAPPVRPDAVGDIARPVTVTRATNLWFVAAGCWLVQSVLVLLLNLPGGATFYYTSYTTTVVDGDQVTVAQTHPASPAVTLAATAVLLVVWLLLIARMRAGANWARITLTILGVIGELVVATQLANSLTGGNAVAAIVLGLFGLAVFGLVLTALIMMYQADARPFFRRPR